MRAELPANPPRVHRRGLALPLAVAAVLAAAVLGYLAGAFMERRDERTEVRVVGEGRGSVIHFGSRIGWDASGVLCLSYHHLCLVETGPGEPPLALYTFTTHTVFREQGCEAQWQPDATFESGGSTVTGLFVEGCGGAKFDRRGERVFGPAPRGLDRFPVQVAADGSLTVDTRSLVCGPSSGAPATSCERAPRPD